MNLSFIRVFCMCDASKHSKSASLSIYNRSYPYIELDNIMGLDALSIGLYVVELF